MTIERSNLNQSPDNNRTYLILTVVLIILSLLGFYLYTLIPKKVTDSNDVVVDRSYTPSEDDAPYPTYSSGYQTPTRVAGPTDVPGTKGGIDDGSVSHGPLVTDTFTVAYSPDRKLYEYPEGRGTRYTLYSASGNIAIHVGPSWSWVHPGRQFTDDFKVSGKPTFVYKISNQTLTDFESGSTKYTIQCVHNGSSAIKSECDQLLSDFKLI